MHLDLLKGLYELHILSQHELAFQFGEYDAEDMRNSLIIQFCILKENSI